MMDDAKKKRLAAAGWRVGEVAEFLGLSLDEEKLVEERVAARVPQHADNPAKFRAEAIAALTTAGFPEEIVAEVFDLTEISEGIRDLLALWASADPEEKTNLLNDITEAVQDERRARS